MAVTNYIWDTVSDNVLMETDELGSTTVTYSNEPELYGGLVSQRRGSATSFYHFDGLGSTRELTDSAETVTDTNVYDAFGVNVDSTGARENPFRFVGSRGYYHDEEMDDYYVRARMYHPTLSRWTSVDPLGFEDGTNLYVFLINDPMNVIDPSGELTVKRIKDNLVKDKLPQSKCGRNSYIQWEFTLNKTSAQNCGIFRRGFIIQKIEIWCGDQVCPTCEECKIRPDKLGAPNIVFWEAWNVGAGSKIGEAREGKKPLLEFTDQSNYQPEDGHCGYFVAKGEVRFFCRKDTGNLGKVGQPEKKWKPPKEGYRDPNNFFCKASSGDVPSTNDPDDVKDFWPTKSKEGPAYRELTCDYNCCVEGKKTAKCTAKPM